MINLPGSVILTSLFCCRLEKKEKKRMAGMFYSVLMHAMHLLLTPVRETRTNGGGTSSYSSRDIHSSHSA